MKINPAKVVYVYYKPLKDKVFVGRLLTKSNNILFEYDQSFLKKNLHISPFKLPLKSGVIAMNDKVFEGLFGVFNDSLPDGWGRLLLHRALIKHDINPGSLSAIDRLCFIGSQGMGALVYEPEIDDLSPKTYKSLDKISREIIEFQEHDNDQYVEDLLKLGGSSAGARPKVLMFLDNEHWLIKFPSHTDPKDIGAIEYAYHLMAKDAELEVPKAKLFPARKGSGFFGVTRFDRMKASRIHMHTVSGLLHADHRIPSLDYEMILNLTLHLTRNVHECIKQYRLCVFNVLSHNRDDHAKNFSFLMNLDGDWRMSPAYDLTFSTGPGAEHCSMIMGEGKKPGLSHLLELAKVGGIKESEALAIIDQVKSSVSKWPEFARIAGVGRSNIKFIDGTIQNIIKECF